MEGGDALRDAAVVAGYQLGVFDGAARTLDEIADANGIAKGRRRMRPLLDFLIAMGHLTRDGERVVAANVPAPREVAHAGWGMMVEVFRADKALPIEGGEVEKRYHAHLTEVGAPAAAELAQLIGGASLLDLGCGAGTYTAAFLDAHPEARATGIDFWDVVPIAKKFLARFGERVQLIGDEISTVQGRDEYEVALLANVVHLHAPVFCQKYIERAARLLVPGGKLVIKDLRLDEDRCGPISGLMFALNMAIYTGGGDVYPTSQLRAWCEAAQLGAIEEHRLESSPDSIVLVAYKSRGAAEIFGAVTGMAEPALEYSETLPNLPASLRRMASHASAAMPQLAEQIRQHYALEMPKQRTAQLANDGDPLLHHPLAWHRMPRMREAIERLFALLHDCGVTTGIVGCVTPKALYAAAPSLARLYERTAFGGAMPMLYGSPADLVYIASHGVARGEDRDQSIDRYLVAPVLHELCHFARDRDALPPHLDECMGGWLAVHVWPEFAYPEAGQDDAIYAAPWLAQVGQAFARAFGVAPIVRAQAGALPWDAALPPSLIEKLTRAAWSDWRARQSLHFLADTFHPDPWVSLALEGPVPADPAFDRAIVRDALRAMCLATEQVGGSFRTRARVDQAAITIDAVAGQVTTAPHTALDIVPPRYWLPPAVATRMRARGHAGYDLFLGSLDSIPAAVATLCDGALPNSFALVPRELGDPGR